MIIVLNERYQLWSPPPDAEAVELDLGCGRGGFLVQLATRYPARHVIGADVMLGRLRRTDHKITRRHLANVTLLRVEAWGLLAINLPDHCLDRVHVLCPDPWPKARHCGRRLLSSEFLGRLATKLKPGGVLHFASDQQPYLDFFRQALAGLDVYVEAPEAIVDVADLKTDFEREFEAAGTAVTHLAFRRRETR